MAGYSKRHYGAVQVAARDAEADRRALRGRRQHQRDLQHLRPEPARRRVRGAAGRLLALRGRGRTARSAKFVRTDVRCRHVVGLNHVAIGIEHVGFSDGDVLNRPAQLQASLALTDWLRCRFGIPVKEVIGHNESLSSPFYRSSTRASGAAPTGTSGRPRCGPIAASCAPAPRCGVSQVPGARGSRLPPRGRGADPRGQGHGRRRGRDRSGPRRRRGQRGRAGRRAGRAPSRARSGHSTSRPGSSRPPASRAGAATVTELVRLARAASTRSAGSTPTRPG